MADQNVPNGYRIEQAVSVWQSARARLLADDGDLAHDEAALVDLLGTETGDVRNILERLLRATLHAEDMAAAASERAATIKGREARYKSRAQHMRATAFAIMDVIGERKIELPDLTASMRNGAASALITDETILPDAYVRIETKRTPDRVAILADLKQGVVIKGATLANGIPSLAIRSK